MYRVAGYSTVSSDEPAGIGIDLTIAGLGLHYHQVWSDYDVVGVAAWTYYTTVKEVSTVRVAKCCCHSSLAGYTDPGPSDVGVG